MKKITASIKLLISTFNHYRVFGKDGIRFALKQRLTRNSLIHIKPKGFLHNIYLRNNTADIPMFYGVFKEKEFDIFVDFQPKVIIDCGGHIGLSAIYFANKYPEATIYSIEPEHANFELLRMNTRQYTNVTCLNYGIWSEPSILNVVDVKEGNWGFQTKPTLTKNEGSIEAITIDALVNQFNIDQIDICKINIEGAEKELFEKNYEEWLSRTKVIVIELHDRMKEGCSKSFFNALSKFKFWLSWKGAYAIVNLYK